MDLIFTYENWAAFISMLPLHSEIDGESFCDCQLIAKGVDISGGEKKRVITFCPNCQENCEFFVKFERE
jgi:hypothetical protein